MGVRSATTWVLATVGTLACGGGCVSSGPLAGGTSLNEMATQARRPVASAAYDEEKPSNGLAHGRDATGSRPAPDAESGTRPDPDRSFADSSDRTESTVDETAFARMLAELPPEEAAAFRRMLEALKSGGERAMSVAEEPPASARRNADPPALAGQDYVPTDSQPPQGDPHGHAANATTPRERYADVNVSVLPRGPSSQFVTDSLAAFTGLGRAPVDDSPISRALLSANSKIAPTNPTGLADGPNPPRKSTSNEIHLTSADSEVDGVPIEPTSTGDAPAPLPIPPAPDWQGKLAEASKGLEVALQRQNVPEKERKALEAKLRLLQAIEHRFGDAMDPISGSPEEQGFWKELCGALQELFDPQATPYDEKRATLALRRLDEAARQLSRSADLDISRLAFCTAVDRFGHYDEFPQYVFESDAEALLYVEVRRFAAETVEQPFPGYRTALEGSYRITEIGTGRRWDDHVFPVAEEVSRSPRRDFFIAYRLYLPRNLPAGKYRLDFNLHDQVGDKHGSGWLDFSVKAPR